MVFAAERHRAGDGDNERKRQSRCMTDPDAELRVKKLTPLPLVL
jgi:hypothetical protein